MVLPAFNRDISIFVSQVCHLLAGPAIIIRMVNQFSLRVGSMSRDVSNPPRGLFNSFLTSLRFSETWTLAEDIELGDSTTNIPREASGPLEEANRD